MQYGTGVVTSAELRRRARARAEKFSWERCALVTLQAYEAIA
jgi:glycosyltransferase involved in cell wall biosynthesis